MTTDPLDPATVMNAVDSIDARMKDGMSMAKALMDLAETYDKGVLHEAVTMLIRLGATDRMKP